MLLVDIVVELSGLYDTFAHSISHFLSLIFCLSFYISLFLRLSLSALGPHTSDRLPLGIPSPISRNCIDSIIFN